MEFFILALVAGALFSLALSGASKPQPPACKYHNWVYDYKEHLVCAKCKHYPGTNTGTSEYPE